MAPVHESLYFPPLDGCLSGDERLISWKTAYHALCDPVAAEDSTALQTFLTDSQSQNILSRPLQPFAAPEAQSKSDFETKTAPIQVSESASGDYDLGELKRDALWLSEQLRIEELAALRIVILEWQQRAEDVLLLDTTAAQDALNAASDLNTSVFGKSAIASSESKTRVSELGKEAVRRDRQLEIFLEEKNYILKVSVQLVGRSAMHALDTAQRTSWVDELARGILASQFSPNDSSAHESFIETCVSDVGERLDRLGDISKRPSVFNANDARQLLYATAAFQDVITSMRLLLTSVYMFDTLLGPRAIQQWFQMMANYAFLQDVSPSPALRDPTALQCLASIVSLALLQLPEQELRLKESAISALEGSLYPTLGDGGWLSDNTCVKEINLILCRAAQANIALAAPAMYAWGLLTSIIRDVVKAQQDLREQKSIEDGSSELDITTRRRSSVRDPADQSVFETRLALLQDFDLDSEIRDDPPSYLNSAAVDRLKVYDVMSALSDATTAAWGSAAEASSAYLCRSALLDLARQATPAIAYDAEVLGAILTIIAPEPSGSSSSIDHHLAARFAGDPQIFGKHIIDQAVARYPFELAPMLRVFRVLSLARSASSQGAATVVQVLEALPTMTVMVAANFNAYVLDHEDENTNSVRLTNDLPLVAARDYRSTGEARPLSSQGQVNAVRIPSGAPGVVVKESRPMIFKLEHAHKGLEFLGLLLSTLLSNSASLVPQTGADLDCETAAEIIALLTALLKASLKQDQGIEEAQLVLARFSAALPDNRDIVAVVTDLFEAELLANLDQSGQEGSLDLLVASAEFFDQLTTISSERVWSMLSRSSLLGLSGGTNALSAVVGAAEVQTGQFRFLTACTKIFSHLLDDAVSGIVRRKGRASRALNRFDAPAYSLDSTPERTMTNVLGAYQTVMLDVWLALPDWRFAAPSEKYEITALIIDAFHRCLLGTLGIGTAGTGDRRLANMLISAAANLIDTFAPPVGTSVALRRFAPVFASGMAIADDLFPTHARIALTQQSNAAMAFCTTLVRAVRMDDPSGKRAFRASFELVKSMPTFATLLAADHAFKKTLSSLLSELVQAVESQEGSEPPSLLSKLDSEVALSFLSVFSQLDRPLKDVSVESSMWRFLAAIMDSKQQWFAMYLLIGVLPKDRLKHQCKTNETAKRKSLLTRALDLLTNIATLAPERATAMLKFVASSQNAWVWATVTVRSHHGFLENALQWLNGLEARAPNVGQELILATEHEMAAHLCDILAVNLHASLEIGDTTLLKQLVPKLAFLREHAVQVDAYNRSLHRNLAENFSKKFPHCDMNDFRRTVANPAPYGTEYVYDLQFATQVLQHDVAWHGAHARKNQGFIDEFARANVNLSLVDAQTKLLTGWNVLATTLCECAGQLESLRVELAKTAVRCLSTNVDANLEQPGMDQVVRTRTLMAFVIISKLVAVKASVPEMKTLLPAAWDLVRASPVDYDMATATEDVQYYRVLLQVLYLAIQPHVYIEDRPLNPTRGAGAADESRVEIADISIGAGLVEIVARVVAPGFRALCGNLHGNATLALPGDFALLTALLQAIFAVRGVTAVHTQIADVVAGSGIIRGALSLYSWADHLAEAMDQDPIYGEVAITFLQALSTVQPIAEQIALDGALLQISSANLSNYLRKAGGKGPWDEPRRMFDVWTQGLLPLCLNLLDAVGPPIAAEVAIFLNSFPAQLARAQTGLENREATALRPHAGAVSLGLAAEARGLCTLALVLASDTARGAAGGIDAADVPRLALDHARLAADAAALLRQRSSLAARIEPVNEREAEWAARAVEGCGTENLLQSRVVRELEALVACYEGEDGKQ